MKISKKKSKHMIIRGNGDRLNIVLKVEEIETIGQIEKTCKPGWKMSFGQQTLG